MMGAVDNMMDEDASLITLYFGEDIKEEDVGRHLKSYENEYRP